MTDELQPYKEETMEEKPFECIDFVKYPPNTDKFEIILGDYEIKEENGKYYAVKKKPQYPKTYQECCDILKVEVDYGIALTYMHEQMLFSGLYELIRCRNAYWKITGEKLGLGKPWEPDWSNGDETKFCIYTTQNIISLDIFGVDNRILAFPTEEMRDAFYENFKDLIEQCKEVV